MFTRFSSTFLFCNLSARNQRVYARNKTFYLKLLRPTNLSALCFATTVCYYIYLSGLLTQLSSNTVCCVSPTSCTFTKPKTDPYSNTACNSLHLRPPWKKFLVKCTELFAKPPLQTNQSSDPTQNCWSSVPCFGTRTQNQEYKTFMAIHTTALQAKAIAAALRRPRATELTRRASRKPSEPEIRRTHTRSRRSALKGKRPAPVYS